MQPSHHLSTNHVTVEQHGEHFNLLCFGSRVKFGPLALAALNLPGLKTERLTHAEAKLATAKIGKALAREKGSKDSGK